MNIGFKDMQHKLLQWYAINKRILPWRSSSDPYKIWISEIVLQQTRVAQGLSYYERLVERYPTVESFAQSNEDELLKLWQGLGYYSRARNMHTAAKQVVNFMDGIFPSNYKQLLTLKGVGPYTAAAIASIAANEPVAVVDGNVDRVLSRLFMVEEAVNQTAGKKLIAQLANEFLNCSDPASHNQALMELGALVCSPKSPSCNACPLVQNCQANMSNRQTDFPVKTKKMKQRTRFFNYFWVEGKAGVYMRKRAEGDIWQGLYEPILIETSVKQNDEEAMKSIIDLAGLKSSELYISSASEPLKHVLSHQTIMAQFYKIRVDGGAVNEPVAGYELIEKQEVLNYPVSRLTERFMQQNGLDVELEKE